MPMPWRSAMKAFRLLVIVLISTSSGSDFSNLVWSDEFDATVIDRQKWSFQTGDGCPDLCGFGNDELEWYRETNAFVDNGSLVIEARQQQFNGKNYTSARLITLGHADWQYGKFEIRARLPGGKGLWPAVWMLPSEGNNWPETGEIDIMEHKGNRPNQIQSTIHYGKSYQDHQSQTIVFTNGDFQEYFHVFGLEWYPDVIRFFVDDQEILNATKNSLTSAGYAWPFDARFYLLLNVAVGGNYPGDPDGFTQFPQRMEVDYVRIYQN